MTYSLRMKSISIIMFLVTLGLLSSSFTYTSKTQTYETPPPAPSCCGQSPDKPHFLAASYYNVGNNLTATLMLNNKGPVPVEVKPTLFSLTGERLETAPVIVEGESFRNIDLRDLGALPGTLFQEGSLQLFHRGPDLVIGAQLYLVDNQHSLSFDEKLVEFQGAATQLEAVWWLPSRRASVNLILSNTSDLEVTAQAVLNAGTPDQERVDVTLSPHETRVIKMQWERRGRGPKQKDDVGSASINYTGEKGSLVARALIADKDSGYSFSAQFYSPQGGKSSGYQGVGLRLGKVRGQELTPIVVARNVGDVPTSISGRLPYTTESGSTGVVQLPTVRLAAGEASSIEIERAIKKAVRTKDIATASLEFDYTTAPGSVMMTAESVSEDGNQVFRVPMWDVPAQRNGTGGYPWFIEGDSSTFVYIKNVTNQEQKYLFSLTYEGGDYSLGLKSIKAGETVVLDIRAMRDKQIPDERGIKIPLEAKRGKINWSVRGPNSLALLGRSEQVDLAKGMSSSYACFMCCPPSHQSSRIDPLSVNLLAGTGGTVRGVQKDRNCYGAPIPEYYIGDTWSSSNSSVVSIDGVGDSADITAVGSGSATITGSWEVYTFTSTYSYEYGLHICETSSSMVEPSRLVPVLPRIDSISPAYGAPGNVVQVSIDGAGFAAGSTVQVGGSGITVSNANVVSSAQMTANFTIAGNASGGTVSVTVTSSGQTSNTAAFSIRVPHHLVVMSDTANNNFRSDCQATFNLNSFPRVRQITYKVVDCAGNEVGPVTVKENFTNMTTNTCNNGGPTPNSCHYPFSNLGNIFTDTITVNCNSVNGSCGLSWTEEWQWCPTGGTITTLATLAYSVHYDVVTIDQNTSGFAAGTLLGPTGCP
jgi:hypothetical protein